MRIKLCIFLTLLINLTDFSYSQSVIDSLKTALNNSQSEEQNIAILNELSSYLLNSDPEASLQRAKQAFAKAKKINDQHGLALAYLRIGNYYDVKSQYDTALLLYDQAMKIGNKQQDQLVLAQTHMRIGITNRYQGNFDEGLTKLREGLNIAEQLNDEFWQAYAHNVIGLVYQQKGDFDLSLKHARIALEIRQKLGSKVDIAASLGNVGLVYDYTGEFDKALDYYFKSLELNEEIGSIRGAAINWNNIGIVKGMQGLLDESLEAFERAFELHAQANNKRYMVSTLDNIGQNYYDRGLFVKALDTYQQTLVIREEIGDKNGIATSLMNIGDIKRLQNRAGEALPNYQKAFQIWAETGDKYGQADALHNLGKVYIELERQDTASSFFEKALSIREAMDNKEGIATCLNSIAQLQRNTGQYALAYAHYERALQLADTIGNAPTGITSLMGMAYTRLAQQRYSQALIFAENARDRLKGSNHKISIQDTYLILSKIHNELGNHQLAYEHHVIYADLRDSLLNTKTSEQLTQMQVQFDTEQKERQILQQEHEIQLLAAANNYRQKMTWTGAAVVFLLLGLGWVYRSRRFAVKEKNIHRHYSQMLLTSHEEERKRISRDLHDSVGQSLMLIKNKVLLNRNEETVDMVSQALEEVRSISKALHPALLDELGLTSSIEKLISEYDESSDIFFTTEIENIDNIFQRDEELHIFRIVQESLNNLIKHANTPSASIEIKNLEQKVTIHIRDFGVGFDLTEMGFTNSLGMKTLKERTQILGGKLAIHSEKNKGTSILLELPKKHL